MASSDLASTALISRSAPDTNPSTSNLQPAHKDKASSISISSQRNQPNFKAAVVVVLRHPPQIRRKRPQPIRQPGTKRQKRKPTQCAPISQFPLLPNKLTSHTADDTRLRARELSGPVLLSQVSRVGTDRKNPNPCDRQAGVLVHEDKVIPSKINDRPAKCPIVDPSTFSRGEGARAPCCCGGPHGACNPRVLLMQANRLRYVSDADQSSKLAP